MMLEVFVARRTDPKHDLGGLFILDERGVILKRGVIL